MEFRILGPLEVVADGQRVAIDGAKQRALLALLVIHANETLPTDRLIDELWGERPPASAQKTLQVHVSRLRKALERSGVGDGLLLTRERGYELRVERALIDACRFERLVAEGRQTLRDGRAEEALSLLEQSLSLWRGRPLAEFTSEPFALTEGARLGELRVAALEELIEAKLALGRHSEVVGELESLIAKHPYRERLRGQLMLALYRSDRQAEALQAYQDARRKLVEELGIEPGERLRERERAIFAQDPALAFVDDPQAVRVSGDALTGAPVDDRAHPKSTPRGPRRWRVVAGPSVLVLLGVAVLIATIGGGRDAALTNTLQSPAIATLNARTGRVRAASTIAQLATRIIASQGELWATSYDDGSLLRIDPRRLLVTQAINIGHGATGVTVAAGDVWVASSLDGTLSRVDIPTESVVQRIPVGTDPTDVAAGDGAVWVSNTADGTVSRVDEHTGQVVATIPVGASPRGVAVGSGGVWVADSASDELVRLAPRTGQVRDRIQVGQSPTQVAVGRDGVWVANELDSTVSLIDPSTDAVRLTKTVAGIPGALAPARNGIWVAASDRPTLTFVQASGATRQTQLPSLVTALAPTANGPVIAVRGLGASHRGGTLVIITSLPIGQVNPDQCCDNPWPGLAYDSLVSLSKLPDSAGALVPDLATAIPRAEAGGRVYTFHLRPGIRYWTGARVRASDFLRGLERAATSTDIFAGYLAALPGALSCPRHPHKCDLGKSVITDDRAGTVTLKLSHPDPELLLVLGLPSTPAPPGGGITPGTGPYRVAKFVPGHLLVYERNPYFRQWSQAAQPAAYPDKIIVRSGVPPSSSVTAVLNGHADLTTDQPTAAQLSQIELQKPRQLHISPLPSVDAMFLDTHRRPFDDIRVRRALNFAVDRDAIVKLFGGTADAAPDCQYIPATVPGHQPYCPYTQSPSRSGRWTAPDLPRAKALIAASATSGESVTVVTQPGFPAAEPTGRYFVTLLDQLGYHARLRLLQPDQFGAALDDYRHPVQIGTFDWVADFDSPSEWLTKFLSCAAWDPPLNLNNHARFCDPQLDRLAARAAALELSDPGAAEQLWAHADRLATNLAPWVPTVSENFVALVSSRVNNYQFIPGFGPAVDQLWVR